MQLTDGSSARVKSYVYELLLLYRTILGFIINGTADHPVNSAILGSPRVFITRLEKLLDKDFHFLHFGMKAIIKH